MFWFRAEEIEPLRSGSLEIMIIRLAAERFDDDADSRTGRYNVLNSIDFLIYYSPDFIISFINRRGLR
jgi:hypothetical protein